MKSLQVTFDYIRLLFYVIYRLLRNPIYQLHKSLFASRGKSMADKLEMLKIVCKMKRSIGMELGRPVDFMFLHERFAPLHILKGPCWMPYASDSEFAYFVKMAKPAAHYTTKTAAGCYEAQYACATALARTETRHFLAEIHSISKKIDPKRLLIMTHCPRAGSTLLSKMLQVENHSLVYGQPSFIVHLMIQAVQNGHLTEIESQVLKAMMQYLFRSAAPGHLCVLRADSNDAILAPLIKRLYPESMHIFQVRLNRGAASTLRMNQIDLISHRMGQISYLCKPFGRWLSVVAGKSHWFDAGNRLRPGLRDFVPEDATEFALFYYASPFSIYRKHKQVYSLEPIIFETLIENTERVLRQLFEFVGLPQECIPASLECLKENAQETTFSGVFNKVPYPVVEMTSRRRDRLLRMADALGLEHEFIEKQF